MEIKRVFIEQINRLERLDEQDQANVVNLFEILNYVTKDRSDPIFQEFYAFFSRKIQEQELRGSVIARVFFIYKLHKNDN